jgi:hypothetical protein
MPVDILIAGGEAAWSGGSVVLGEAEKPTMNAYGGKKLKQQAFPSSAKEMANFGAPSN